MGGILDILCSDIVVGQSDFVANSAVNDVAVNNVGPTGLGFINGNGATKFQLGDNIRIRKIWATVPWGFGQGAAYAPAFSHRIAISWYDGVVTTTIPILGSATLIPVLCEPLDFGDGLYAPMITAGLPRGLQLTLVGLRISQLNLPAGLNGVRVPVQYFVEVLHNLDMTL